MASHFHLPVTLTSVGQELTGSFFGTLPSSANTRPVLRECPPLQHPAGWLTVPFVIWCYRLVCSRAREPSKVVRFVSVHVFAWQFISTFYQYTERGFISGNVIRRWNGRTGFVRRRCRVYLRLSWWCSSSYLRCTFPKWKSLTFVKN